MKNLSYDKLLMQEYLLSDQFSIEEKELLYSLRSMCYPAKMNFRKMHKGNLNCSLQCGKPETQVHTFQYCTPIISQMDISNIVEVKDIYGDIKEQKKALQIFI